MERTCSSLQATTSVERDVMPLRRVVAPATSRRVVANRAALLTKRAGGGCRHVPLRGEVVCNGGKDSVGGILRDAIAAGKSPTGVNEAYGAGAAFLAQELGIDGTTEASRILDIAMNPNSLYVPKRSKLRGYNASARRLSVDDDMRPVVDFLRGQGLSKEDVRRVVSEHPPVLSYSVDSELVPLVTYIAQLCSNGSGSSSGDGGSNGSDAAGAAAGQQEEAEGEGKAVGADLRSVLVRRPSLLGLRGGDALERIVGYLQANEYSQEQILEYLATSL